MNEVKIKLIDLEILQRSPTGGFNVLNLVPPGLGENKDVFPLVRFVYVDDLIQCYANHVLVMVVAR